MGDRTVVRQGSVVRIPGAGIRGRRDRFAEARVVASSKGATPRLAPGRSGLVAILSAGIVLALTGAVFAQSGREKGGAKAPEEPIDRQSYKIMAHVAIDPETRIDARRREALLASWETMIQRFVGAPWDLTLADEGDGPLATAPLESLAPADFTEASADFDKVWVIRVAREGAGYALSGREFDTDTGRLGPIHRRSAPFVPDAARELFQLALEVFSPSAVIGDHFGKNVNLTVRGSSLEAASPIGRVVSVGTVFQPLRIVALKEGKTSVLEIHFSYLQVEAVEGSVVRCSMVSIFSDPLTKRMVQPNSLVALGIKAGKMPTRLRFVTNPDKAPAAGYLLTARTLPNGVAQEVGTTDREGRIVVPAGFADSLVVLRLLAGNVEPMVEFPAMPGETTAERTIPFQPKPLTVTLETQLDSLRDEVIDLVAVRARLEARLKARYDGEDWAGIEAIMKEFYQLPSRGGFADRLTKLKEQAVEQQTTTKTAVLTKTAQAQLADVQALVDRYLDDEIFNGYADAVKRARSQAASEAKADAKKKAARARAGSGFPPVEKSSNASTPQAAPAPKPAPKAAPGAVPF